MGYWAIGSRLWPLGIAPGDWLTLTLSLALCHPVESKPEAGAANAQSL